VLRPISARVGPSDARRGFASRFCCRLRLARRRLREGPDSECRLLTWVPPATTRVREPGRSETWTVSSNCLSRIRIVRIRPFHTTSAHSSIGEIPDTGKVTPVGIPDPLSALVMWTFSPCLDFRRVPSGIAGAESGVNARWPALVSGPLGMSRLSRGRGEMSDSGSWM